MVSDGNEIRSEPLDWAAGQVRDQYSSAWPGSRLVPLGNGGGFSGARLWRCEGVAGHLCLRAWPAAKTAGWVRRLHRLMEWARQQRLDFIPTVYAARDGDTVIEAAGRVWELTQWLEGRADFAENPSATRLEASSEAVARLHRAWEVFTTPAEPCPAVRIRWKLLRDWQDLVATGWQPRAPAAPALDPVWPLAEWAWRGLPAWLRVVSQSLNPWLDFRCPVQPCLRDLWHDHLLFERDRLTGLIDYGAVGGDHVGADLARMLGSLVGDDAAGWERGLRSYRRVRDLNEHDEQLAHVLDRSSTILGLVNWLRWMYYQGRTYQNPSAVAQRLETLLNRIENWAS